MQSITKSILRKLSPRPKWKDIDVSTSRAWNDDGEKTVEKFTRKYQNTCFKITHSNIPPFFSNFKDAYS